MYILSPSPTARVGVVTVMPVLSLVACFLSMWQRKRVHTLRVGVTTRLWDLVRPVGIPGVLLLQVPCGVAGACGGVLRKNRPVHRQQARTLPLCPQVLPTQCAWIPEVQHVPPDRGWCVLGLVEHEVGWVTNE